MERARGRGRGVRLGCEALEARALMAGVIDLGRTATRPYGLELSDVQARRGVGYAVAMLGDVNGDGYQDTLVGAPSVRQAADGSVRLDNAAFDQVALVLGSRVAGRGVVDFRSLSDARRDVDLSTLGNQNRVDGVRFFASQNPNAQLGASVAAAGDLDGDGYDDFLIGAPGGRDANGRNPGAGRAYLVYGGPHLGELLNKVVDLDSMVLEARWRVVVLAGALPNGRAGRAVANIGDVTGDGLPDLAVGAPEASTGGLYRNGAVYVVSGALVNRKPAQTRTTLDLGRIGQPGGLPGVVLVGGQIDEQVGHALAGVGDVNGRGGPVVSWGEDFLIGAPNARDGAGQAYLIYGSSGLIGAAVNVGGLRAIDLGRVGRPGSSSNAYGRGTIPGLVVRGIRPGDATGWAVAAAGDFNGDGPSVTKRRDDLLIGSPGYDRDSGRVTLLFSRSGNRANPWPLSGSTTIEAIPQRNPSVTFDGAARGDEAGYALAAVGRINRDRAGNLDPYTEILLGAPGVGGNVGAAYLIPGNPELVGIHDLSNATAAPVSARLLTVTHMVGEGLSRANLGAAVAGRLRTTAADWTVDRDAIGDFVVGAPTYSADTAARLAGAAFLVEGAFVSLARLTPPRADVSIRIADSPDPARVGVPLVLTIDVANAGPNIARDVVVTVPLPASTRFVAVDGGGRLSGGKIVFRIARLSPKATRRLQVVLRPQRAGTLVTTATAVTHTSDPRRSNNAATAITRIRGGGASPRAGRARIATLAVGPRARAPFAAR